MMNWFDDLPVSEKSEFNISEYLHDHVTAKKFKFPHGHNTRQSDLKNLADFLITNNSIEILDLSGCDVGIEGMKILSPAIEQNSILKTFQFFSNELGDEGCNILSNALSKRSCKEPVTLGLGLNDLTEKSGLSISVILKTVPIRSLDVSNNDLGHAGVVAIFENAGCTAHSEACIELNVSHTFVSSDPKDPNAKSNALVALSNLLRTPHALKKLDMAGNELTDDDFSLISTAISDSSSRSIPSELTELRLHGNNFTGNSFRTLAALLLDSHHSIEKIDLMQNHKMRSSNGLYVLKEALQKNHIIWDLDLIGTGLCERGKGVLLDAVLDNIAQYKSMLDHDPHKYNLWLRIDKFNDWLGNVPWALKTKNEAQPKIDALQAFCKEEARRFKRPYVEIGIMEEVAAEMVQETLNPAPVLMQFNQNSVQKLSMVDTIEQVVDEDNLQSNKRQRLA
jgi:Ran GTPase-activating protein (RanGAP) involved in mRNA processing and transport